MNKSEIKIVLIDFPFQSFFHIYEDNKERKETKK